MSKEVVAEVIALIELGMIAPDDIVKCLRKANSEPENALAEQPAQQEPVDVDFMRQVLSVAIAGLHQHYKDDVLRVFTLDDLQTVVDLSEPLQSQNVEDIYKRAWAMLAAAPQPAQRKPLTDEQIKEIANNSYSPYQSAVISFARAIEAHHNIKENT